MAARDPRRLLRVVAMAVVGVTLFATGLWILSDDPGAAGGSVVTGQATSDDPVRAGLQRCNDLGSAALDDAGCRAAWAENRRRFFGSSDSRNHPGRTPSPAMPTTQEDR
ncbi:putative entry exclusion protein TrbK-alt [Brevundimonas aurifodinae]|uniref:putative entry exclusion protein TrbK-alt n=1 Tax=Brevundimonas aurifodinae TaxID=1508312 RepID=UPI003D812236